MTRLLLPLLAVVGLLLAVRDSRAAPRNDERPAKRGESDGPVRLLLAASGPGREFQFLRTLFIRQTEARRVDLSLWLQGCDGREWQAGIDPGRWLKHFPSRLRMETDPKEDAEEQRGNLARYDLIVAIDVNWVQVPAEHLALLRRWVEVHGGGLVVVAGPIHTHQLSRPGEGGRMQPMLDLLPVVLEDGRAQVEVATDRPWPLAFAAEAEMPAFLRLDADSKDPLGGWKEFFGTGRPGGPGAAARRGFHSCNPVKAVKAGASVLATYDHPQLRMGNGRAVPFLATHSIGSGRVVYIGSAEIWRLRGYREGWHERFWQGLAQYAAAHQPKSGARHRFRIDPDYFTGKPTQIELQLLGGDGRALQPGKEVRLHLTPPGKAQPLEAIELRRQEEPLGSEGWFRGSVTFPGPGEYGFRLPLPDGGEALSGKLLVPPFNLPTARVNAGLRQKVIERQYLEVEENLLRMAQRLERSPQPADQASGKALKRSLEEVAEKALRSQMARQVQAVQDLASLQKIAAALEASTRVTEGVAVLRGQVDRALSGAKTDDAAALRAAVQRMEEGQRRQTNLLADIKAQLEKELLRLLDGGGSGHPSP